MASRPKTKKRRATRRAWTKQEERELKGHSKNKSPLNTVVRIDETHSGRIAAKSLFSWSVAWASAVNQEEKEAVIVTNWIGR